MVLQMSGSCPDRRLACTVGVPCLRHSALQVHNEPWRVEGSRVITETATDIKHVQQVWDTVLKEGGKQKVRASPWRPNELTPSAAAGRGVAGAAVTPACRSPSGSSLLHDGLLLACHAAASLPPLPLAAAGTAGALGGRLFDECRGTGVPLPLPPGAPLLP